MHAISPQLKAKESVVTGAKRFGEIEVEQIEISLIVDECCNPLLQHTKFREIGRFGNEPML